MKSETRICDQCGKVIEKLHRIAVMEYGGPVGMMPMMNPSENADGEKISKYLERPQMDFCSGICMVKWAEVCS